MSRRTTHGGALRSSQAMFCSARTRPEVAARRRSDRRARARRATTSRFDPDICATSTARSATSGCATTATSSTSRSSASSSATSTTPTSSPIEREPLTDEVEVLIIGGGFGGLLAGARLREAGIDDIRMVEKGGDFGGTWYWNRYPGAACDVESYVYLPLLEEIGYMPKEKYSQAPRSSPTARRSAGTSTSTATPVPDRGHRAALGRRRRRWIVGTNRGDAHARPLRRDGERAAAPPEAARHRRASPTSGSHLPHQPLGLRLHRRRSDGGT
jgi:hypothetical protein